MFDSVYLTEQLLQTLTGVNIHPLYLDINFIPLPNKLTEET